MDTNANRERWIDEVMESTKGIARAQPGGDLFERVMAGTTKPATNKTVAIPVTRWVAAAILLLALNVGSAVYFNTKSEKNEHNSTNPFATAMMAESTYNY